MSGRNVSQHIDVLHMKPDVLLYMAFRNQSRFIAEGGHEVAEYRTVTVSFWCSPYIETLNIAERLLYLYLFTNHHVNNSGVMQVSRRTMAFETGIDDISHCIDRLKTDGKLVEIDGYFWVTGFIEHQTANSPKIAVSIIRSLLKVPETLVQMVCDRYPKLRSAYESASNTADLHDTPALPYRYGIDTVSIPYGELEGEREGEEEEKQKGKKSLPEAFLKSSFRDEAFAFADWFAKELKPDSLRMTEKARNEWALVWYHLRVTDGRNTDSDKKIMQDAIIWARRDGFWCKNFMSPLKLRKKDREGIMYVDRFIEAMKAAANPRTNGAAQSVRVPVYELAKPLSMEA
jgi:hypothetical protein